MRKQIEDEKLQMQANFEERIKRDVEEAKHVTWTAATRQQERAVEVALHEQNYTLDRTRQEVEDQRARVKEELGEAYHSIKKELLQDLQQQHSHNLNLAVQAAWDRATREKEQVMLQPCSLRCSKSRSGLDALHVSTDLHADTVVRRDAPGCAMHHQRQVDIFPPLGGSCGNRAHEGGDATGQ